MTALKAVIAEQVAQSGPMSLAAYMALCLQHPEHGYYITRDPLGRDFTTAPEISQMFGELIGLCLAQSWLDQGAPTPFTLAELGPGRGTLMADALRAARRVPGFLEGARITLVETSPALKQVQAQALAGFDAAWVQRVEDLPEAPLFLVANEFFDALPIRQFSRADGSLWHEHRVGLEGDVLRLGRAGAAPVPALDHRLEDTRPEDIVEMCPAAGGVAAEIAARIGAHRGVALYIDYGDWRALGDTFQALKGGKTTDPFEAPGQADLTAHVDFEAIAMASGAASFTKLATQALFLERLGIGARAEALARNASGDALEQLTDAHRRLTSPVEMGHLFKVMGIMPKGAHPPPGLEAIERSR